MSTKSSSGANREAPPSATPTVVVARLLPGAVVRIRDNYPVDGGSETVLYSCKPYRGRIGKVSGYDRFAPEYVRVELVGRPLSMLGQGEWHFREEELEEFKQ